MLRREIFGGRELPEFRGVMMNSNETELSAERLAQAVQELPPEEVANLILANRGNLPPAEIVAEIIGSLPREQGVKVIEGIVAHFPPDVFEKFIAALEGCEKMERQKGRALGAELINRVLRKELSPEEASEKPSSLPPMQFLEARKILSLVSRTNEALHRITKGEAPIELDLPADEDGYYDRMCPSTECRGKFKIYYEDWVNKDFELVRCPFCGYRSRHDDFDTPTQREHVRYRGMRVVEEVIRGHNTYFSECRA